MVSVGMYLSKRPKASPWREAMDALEIRLLLAAAEPTSYDQYMLELINRARANPVAEAARYGINLNEGVPATSTISDGAKQPLAFSGVITDVARGHSQDMLDHDYFAHTSLTGQSPEQRLSASGYVFDQGGGSGENLAFTASFPAVPGLTEATADLHLHLFTDVDYNGVAYPNRAHRVNILYGDFKEIGVGVVSGAYYIAAQKIDYNAVMATIDFGYRSNTVFLTGVAFYDDVVADQFYEPGEGIGGLTINAVRDSDGATFSTAAFASGGYTLPIEAGTYAVTASGPGLETPMVVQNVVIGQDNVKVDFIKPRISPGEIPDKTPPSAKYSGSRLVTTAAASYKFTVTYSDPSKVRRSTVGAGDLVVTGPKGFKAIKPTFVSTKAKTDAVTISAVYSFVPPGKKWSAALNGTYTVTLNAKQVADAKGNMLARSLVLGTFVVSLKKTKTSAKTSPVMLNGLLVSRYPAAGLFATSPIRRATSDIF